MICLQDSYGLLSDEIIGRRRYLESEHDQNAEAPFGGLKLIVKSDDMRQISGIIL